MPTSKRIVIAASLAIGTLIAFASAGEAQYRGRRVVVRAPVFVGGYYSPYRLYDPWFGFDYQYPWGPYPYGYPPNRFYNIDPGAAIRLDVKPHQAEVYVDGYYAGVVDDFDGAFQRLRIRPGEHEIVLYLEGYRTVRQKLLLTPNNTFKVKYAMEPLGTGEQPDARPQPANPPPQQAGPPPPMGPPTGPQPGRGPIGRRAPQGPPQGQPQGSPAGSPAAPPPQGPPMPGGPPPGSPTGPPPQGPPMPGGPPRGNEASTYGTLAIRVQPRDAEVLIDGEAWRGPDAQDRLIVEVAEGPHTIEIRKPGYRPYVTQAQVRRGETTPINVSLRSQE